MNKRKGQIELSFGVIFSIIIIIATIALGVYFIQKFISTSDCVTVNEFTRKLQDSIDRAWRSPVAQQEFSGNLPTNIESICFGSINLRGNGEYSEEYAELERYKNMDGNLFFYPPTKACGGRNAYTKLEHTKVNSFFCVKNQKGKITLRIVKESAETQEVEISNVVERV